MHGDRQTPEMKDGSIAVDVAMMQRGKTRIMTNTQSTIEQDTIAVTGANRGIGAAIATELANRGYTVACLTRSGEKPPDKDLDPDTATRLVGLRCDITDDASVVRAVAEANTIANGLIGVVNNAGVMLSGPSRNFSTEDFARVLNTNVIGAFSVCRAAYPHLAAHGNGLIVNIGSFWDQLGVKAFTAYCASKAAIAALSRCLGVEWGKKGIRVVTVAPGYIETDMTSDALQTEETRQYLASRLPLGRVGQPDEIARMVASLFLGNVGFLTATTIYVDGGQGPAM